MKDFIERSRHGRWPVRAASWLLMIAIAIGATLGIASAAHADGDDELAGQLSFYSLASTTATFFSNSLAPEGPQRTEMWADIMESPANAGSMLGYSDKNRNDGSNWLMVAVTAGSHTMSYSAFAGDDELQGALGYVQFGATLSGLGLDGTKSGSGVNFAGLIGMPLLLLYNINGWVAGLFSGLISLLKILNPFLLFHAGVQAVSPEFAAGMAQESHEDYQALHPALQTVSEFIGSIYGALNGLAWGAMVPIFFGLLVVGIMFRGSKFAIQGGGLKKFAIRLVFIGFGLPLVGSMYTMTLNGLSEAVDSDNAPAAQKIMETFVDFENWSKNYALAVPAGATIEWDESRSRPTDKSIIHIRSTANSINRMVNPNIANVYESGGLGLLAEILSGAGTDAAVRDLLGRYRAGDSVSGPDFETAIKPSAMASARNSGDEPMLKSWFTEVTEASLADNESTSLKGNGALIVDDGMGLDAVRTDKIVTFTSPGASLNECKFSGDLGLTNCNLAPMAMYNYLNTSFGSESYTAYSAENSTSLATREVHNSVNMVGDGVTSVLFWVETLVVLAAFVVVGLGYLLGMLISNIRRTIQLVSAIPFATLGAIAGIAKVLVYSFALIVEVIATMFIYVIVQQFLINIPALVGGVFADMLTDSSGSISIPVLSGDGVLVATLVISIVFVLMFMVMALRVRKTVIKAVEEAVTKLVNKFTDTNVGAPGSGGQMMPALAGGVAAGAGAAAMNKAMGGKAKTSDPKGSAGGTGGGAGPAAAGTDGDGDGGTTNNNSSESSDNSSSESSDNSSSESSDNSSSSSESTESATGGASDGSGDTGSSVAVSGDRPSVSANTATTDKGKEVAANGLSDPTAKPGKGDATAAAGANQDDAMSGAAASVEDSAQKYKEADQAKAGVATEGAKAVGHGAVAVGAGAAGDAKTATEHGGKAVAAGAEAKAQAHESKAKADEAGRSSLDKPSSGKHAQKAQQSRQVGQAAGGVGQAAGAANGGKGGTASGGASKAPSTPKPSSGGSKPSPQAPKAPQGGSLQRQQAPRPAPAPRQASAPAPKQQAPRQAPAPKPQQAPVQRPAPQRPVRQQRVSAPRQAPAPKPQQASAPKPTPAPKARGSQRGKPQGGGQEGS